MSIRLLQGIAIEITIWSLTEHHQALSPLASQISILITFYQLQNAEPFIINDYIHSFTTHPDMNLSLVASIITRLCICSLRPL